MQWQNTRKTKENIKKQTENFMVGLNALLCFNWVSTEGMTLVLDWQGRTWGLKGQLFHSWDVDFSILELFKKHTTPILSNFQKGTENDNSYSEINVIRHGFNHGCCENHTKPIHSPGWRDLQVNVTLFFLSFSREYVIDGELLSVSSSHKPYVFSSCTVKRQ